MQNSEIVAIAGIDTGTKICHNVRQCPAPSIFAASSSSSGTCRKKFSMQDDVEYPDGARQHERPNRIHDAKLADQNVVRNEAAVEQSREEENPNVNRPHAKFLPSLWKAGNKNDDEQNIKGRPDRHPFERNEERMPERILLQDVNRCGSSVKLTGHSAPIPRSRPKVAERSATTWTNGRMQTKHVRVKKRTFATLNHFWASVRCPYHR